MIIKIVGATALIVSSGLYGIYSGRKVERSLTQTKDLRNGLNLLKNEIYLNSIPMGSALQRVSLLMTSEIKDVFSECGRAMSAKNGVSLQEYLLSDINDKSIELDSKSKSILSQWSSNAGTGDRKTELDSLEFTIAQLDQHIIDAERQCIKQVRLYRSSGFLLGALVVAVLI